MSWILRVRIIALALLAATEANAQRGKPNRIDIKYVEPKSPDHQPMFKFLKERRALEKVSQLLSPLILPRRLLLQTMGCYGVSNAWYDGESVTVCYTPASNGIGMRGTRSATRCSICGRFRCLAARRTAPISSRPTSC